MNCESPKACKGPGKAARGAQPKASTERATHGATRTLANERAIAMRRKEAIHSAVKGVSVETDGRGASRHGRTARPRRSAAGSRAQRNLAPEARLLGWPSAGVERSGTPRASRPLPCGRISLGSRQAKVWCGSSRPQAIVGRVNDWLLH